MAKAIIKQKCDANYEIVLTIKNTIYTDAGIKSVLEEFFADEITSWTNIRPEVKVKSIKEINYGKNDCGI